MKYQISLIIVSNLQFACLSSLQKRYKMLFIKPSLAKDPFANLTFDPNPAHMRWDLFSRCPLQPATCVQWGSPLMWELFFSSPFFNIYIYIGCTGEVRQLSQLFIMRAIASTNNTSLEYHCARVSRRTGRRHSSRGGLINGGTAPKTNGPEEAAFLFTSRLHSPAPPP